MAKILIIDDDHLVGHSYKRVLLKYEHDVDVEANAIAGLYRANEEVYDLVITDVAMPGVSGIEIIKQLRDSKPELPVIAISGVSQLNILGAFGVDCIMQKPIKAHELLSAVDGQLQERVALANASA